MPQDQMVVPSTEGQEETPSQRTGTTWWSFPPEAHADTQFPDLVLHHILTLS